MRTAETNTLTATWWSRLVSACTITTRRLAVLHVREWPKDSPFSGSAASTLEQGPSAPRRARLGTLLQALLLLSQPEEGTG